MDILNVGTSFQMNDAPNTNDFRRRKRFSPIAAQLFCQRRRRRDVAAAAAAARHHRDIGPIIWPSRGAI